MTALRLLVTGFGPFPGVPVNASGLLASALGKEGAGEGIVLQTAVIPARWSEARSACYEATRRTRPHAVLHMGVSKRAVGLEIETRALNFVACGQDQVGEVRSRGPLVRNGRPVLASTLPPHALVSALKERGYAAELSTDAGQYLCNALFYWSLSESINRHPRVGFIHMPAFGVKTEARPLLSMEETIEAASILVRASARAVLGVRDVDVDRQREGKAAWHGS